MKYFAEIEGFGTNLLTLTFLVTIFFTTLQASAFIKQNIQILKNRSGESVSFPFYSYFGFSALAVSIFGLYKHSLALSINGLLGILTLIIAFNLLRFKKIHLREKQLGILSILVIPLMVISPNKDLIFLLLGLVIGITVAIQIIEIWNNKSSGSYHPAQVFVSISSCTFWLIYGIIMRIWSMQVINSLFLSLWVILLFSYLKFRKTSKT